MKKITSLLVLCNTILCLTWPVAAIEPPNLSENIPLPQDARVFARFDDNLPAVVNYFTRESEQAIVSFYQQHYGEPSSRERKRGRLTMVFSHESAKLRLVISEQDKQRQVDILKMK
ncbi:hypothetical protein [Thalassomonas actiniarum]|uniref:Uncharacterized protein n=1 Tax=Thalassomonas actiniarum TaxID=485447 RepID=A0AAE9YX56_9GAMM|nr:hypothetical protein [Thalassomonas actiniarum]WDE01217.1 hypothetical protein SG35_011565 [Thalassomonas actiniarum]